MTINNDLPTTRFKFLKAHKAKVIYVPQDNAKPHAIMQNCWSKDQESLQHQTSLKTTDELIDFAESAFDALTKETLDYVFLMMMASIGIIYKIEHMNKDKLHRKRRLPVSVMCNQIAIETAELDLNV
ncbi:hypothetical protein Trydic_g11163 [Trypoxylus dichotomus]